ncbi:MAG: hypothetical protein WCF67_07600 [Chitinophagaceae bacterium]
MKNFLILYFFFTICASFQLAKLPQSSQKAILWTADWSADDKYIAWGGDDSLLIIYDAVHQKIFKSVQVNGMIKGMEWHPQSKLLAIATMKGVSLYDLASGQLNNIPGMAGGRGIGWNYNGELLALADGYGKVQIMNKQGQLLKSIKKHNSNGYMTLDWHPSKNIIVTGSDEIILFDTSGRQLAFINHRKEHTGVLTVRWHSSGEFFASGDYGHEGEGMPTLLQFWKEDGTAIKTIKGSKAEYRNIRWTKDGSLLATASDALRIWNKEGELLHSSQSSEDLLWGVAWNSDHTRVVTTSIQGNVKLWDAKARLIRTLR